MTLGGCHWSRCPSKSSSLLKSNGYTMTFDWAVASDFGPTTWRWSLPSTLPKISNALLPTAREGEIMALSTRVSRLKILTRPLTSSCLKSFLVLPQSPYPSLSLPCLQSSQITQSSTRLSRWGRPRSSCPGFRMMTGCNKSVTRQPMMLER